MLGIPRVSIFLKAMKYFIQIEGDSGFQIMLRQGASMGIDHSEQGWDEDGYVSLWLAPMQRSPWPFAYNQQVVVSCLQGR